MLYIESKTQSKANKSEIFILIGVYAGMYESQRDGRKEGQSGEVP